jgi:3-methyladenine DNA glycosylase/8-oxoguanine DNA glycosylase
MTPDLEATVALSGPVELGATLWPLAHGNGDPTIRFGADGIWRATRLPSGTATMHLRQLNADRIAVRAWGSGADDAVAGAAELVGALDDPAALVPQHPVIRETVRRHPGLRLPRSRRVFEALLPAILEQKVTGIEARRSYRALIHAHGERAPGPPGLWVAPAPTALAGLPSYAYHAFGIERRRAEVIRATSRIASRLDAIESPTEADRVLRSLNGIGPWTSAEVRRVALGDPDAVSLGDYHIPNLVAWALAGEPRADDARMLELLAVYVGQRGRVQRLLEASGIRIPRHGPRTAPRSIAAL